MRVSSLGWMFMFGGLAWRSKLTSISDAGSGGSVDGAVYVDDVTQTGCAWNAKRETHAYVGCRRMLKNYSKLLIKLFLVLFFPPPFRCISSSVLSLGESVCLNTCISITTITNNFLLFLPEIKLLHPTHIDTHKQIYTHRHQFRKYIQHIELETPSFATCYIEKLTSTFTYSTETETEQKTHTITHVTKFVCKYI